METGKIVSLIAVIAIAAGIMFAYDKFIAKQEFDLVQTLIRMVTVIVVVAVAGWVWTKVSHKQAAPKITV